MGGFGDVFAAGILGAVGGAGSAVADQALLEQKNQMQQLRDQRLSQLRTQEYQQKLTLTQKIKDQATAQQEQQTGSFFKNTTAPGSPTPYVDTTGSPEDALVAGQSTGATTPPSDMDQATYRYNEALKTGNQGIIKEARARLADVEKLSEQQSHDRFANAQLDLSARRTVADENRADAYIKKTLNMGENTDPAKIREVKDLASMAFGGDVQKAVAFVYGVRDKSRSDAVIQMAGILKNDPELSTDTNKLMQRASDMVDALRLKDTSSRGGVSAGTKPSIGAPTSLEPNRASGVIQRSQSTTDTPPAAYPDAKKAPDGNWYVQRNGKYFRVRQ